MKNELTEKYFLTVNQYKELLSQLKDQYNKGINFAKNKAKEINETSYQINAKLYDIIYEFDETIIDKHFENFCNDEWQFFLDFVNEKGLELSYVGRTSTFRIQSEYLKDIYINEADDAEIYMVYGSPDILEIGYENFVENQKDINSLDAKLFSMSVEEFESLDEERQEDSINEIEMLFQEIEDQIEGIDSFIEEVNNSVNSELDDVKEAYAYLENFKSTQITNFQAYVENNEDF